MGWGRASKGSALHGRAPGSCVRRRPARYCRPSALRRIAMHPEVLPFRHAGTGTWSYVVLDPTSGAAALVDPVLDYDAAAGRTGTRPAPLLVDAVRGRTPEARRVGQEGVG